MKKSALCLVDTEAQAEAIVGKLKSAGFTDDDVSVLFPDKGTTRDFGHKKETKMPEGAAIGATTGGAVGGTIGLLAGIGALAIPGLGPFIAAGPIVAALSAGALGALGGGLTGALVGLGMPEYEAKQYEGKVKEGGILISVHAEIQGEIQSAKDIFKEEGAHDISSTGEAHADDKTRYVSRPATNEVNEVALSTDHPVSLVTDEELTPKTRPALLVTQERIRNRAYLIAERRRAFGETGHKNGDWIQAEQELGREASDNRS